MSHFPKRYCVFGCDFLVTFCVPLHRFPHPTRKPDLFNAWMSVVGDKLQETDQIKIYKSKRLCDHHFDPNDKISIDRIKPSAIPSVNLHRIQQGCTTFLQADHCYTRPPRGSSQSITMMDITNLPGPSRLAINPDETLPSGSTEATCLTTPRTKFDADKTFEYLLQQNETGRAKKIRQKDNEIRRMRLKVKSYKLRLRQLQINQRSNFEKLTQNMSESAKLFTRMQFQEGKKKKKGHRFTLEEKILSLSIFKKSPKAYKLICKHLTLPSRKVLKSLLAQIKLSPGINEIIFKELKNTVSKMLPQDRLCTLIFDEMSISPHLHFNVHTDDLVGFENYGDAEKTANFANHVLVFMVKGIKNCCCPMVPQWYKGPS